MQDLSQESVESLRTQKAKLTRVVLVFAAIDSLYVLAFTILFIRKGLTGSTLLFLPLLAVPLLTMIPRFRKLNAVTKELERRSK